MKLKPVTIFVVVKLNFNIDGITSDYLDEGF
jgi:hypothetical protein